MRHLILAAILATTSLASDSIIIMLPSYHSVDPNNKFNSLTYGVGYEHEFSNNIETHVGAYYNSYSKASLITGIGYNYHVTDLITLSSALSIASGYSTEETVIPTVGLQVGYVKVVSNYLVTNLQIYIPF